MRKIVLQAKSEIELAALLTRQVGNSCSFHVIAAGVRLLLDQQADPMVLSEEVNRLWWRGRFMRVAPNWAVTPRMQVRIVRHLARTSGFPLTADYSEGDPETLPDVLSDPGCVPVITLTWLWRKAPPIYYANTTLNFNQTRSAGGHTMLFAAYDPDHWAEEQFATPWGFINPWMENAHHLFWMGDADFRKAWRFRLPRIGPNPLVTIRYSA